MKSLHQRLAIAIIIAAMAAAIIAISFPAKTHAATVTGTMNVSATVIKNCAFTTGTLAFGNYDPVATNASSGADLKVTDSNAALSISCTKGLSAQITLNNGNNSGGSCSGSGPACLKDGAGDLLNYAVYTDNTFATQWTGATAVTYNSAGVTAQALKMNGDIFKGQNVPAASYTDTITATATF